jgi:hypothetical protein
MNKKDMSDLQMQVLGSLNEHDKTVKSDRDVTDDARLQEMLYIEDGPKKKVSFKLTSEEKLAMYTDIRTRIEDGESPSNIARDVIACLDEFLNEKQDEAYNTKGPQKGMIRRVND